VPVQQKIEVDEEKDLGKDEAEPKEPGFPEETKIEDKEEPFPKSEKEAVVPKPGEASYLFHFFSVSPYSTSGDPKKENRDANYRDIKKEIKME
jgi:hypothetical protein